MDFNFESLNWDTPRRAARAKIIADEIKKNLIHGKKGKALEYGCGTGLIGMNLTDCFDTVTFMDSSQGMIDQLNKKTGKLNIENINTCCLDILETAHPDRYDIIFSSMVLHHVENAKGIFSEFYRLLNPAGKLIIVDMDKDDGSFHKAENDFHGHNGFIQDDFLNTAKNTGFKDNKIYTFYKGLKKINNEDTAYSLFIFSGSK